MKHLFLFLLLLFASESIAQLNTGPDLSTYDRVVPYTIDVVRSDELETDQYYAVKKNRKWGAVNQQGQVIIPIAYDTLIPFPGNFSIGAKKVKFGLIDLKGKELTPFRYDSMYSDYSRHLIAVTKNKLGLVSDEGVELTAQVYTRLTRQSTYGCRCAQKNGRFAILSGAGKELTTFVYDQLQNYEPPTDVWVLRKQGKWGFYDCEKQKEISDFIYDDVTRFWVDGAEVIVKGVKKEIRLK